MIASSAAKASHYDAIIIGGGHNGLVCGGYLARAGLRTLVLERRSVVGGAAVTEEIVPGFKFSVFSYGVGHLHPKVNKELELEKFGLRAVKHNDLFVPISTKDFFIYSGDVSVTQRNIARFSPRDAQRYPEFLAYLAELGPVFHRLLMETPIDPSKQDWKSFKENFSFLWRYRKIGDRIYKMMDLFTQSADEFLSQWFESSVIRAHFSYWAGVGNMIGPKSPGSAWATLYYLFTMSDFGVANAGPSPRGHAIGGMGAVTQALAASGRKAGLEIKLNSDVIKVGTLNGRVTGVTTTDGSEYSAAIVVSNAHCKILFDDLVDEQQLPTGFLDDIRRFKTFSAAWKINVACDTAPKFAAFDRERSGLEAVTFAHIGPDIDYLERAYDDAKYGWYSSKPWMSVGTPSLIDDTMAPAGKHVVNLFGGHAPYELKDASWDNEREGFLKSVMDVLDDYAPGFSSSIIDMQVLLPPDIERILNIPHGHILHGEMSADQQFFKRPVPHYSDYRSPIHGLYQCGSSCHPGGCVSGIPGHNAAREILLDVSKRKRLWAR
ncbi:MAG: NAD(P)/FAD-dependent oxidoreductase [Mesorhizobium sp.]|uniref:phytoene desaturase family protein n=1 Tax=Mesorhizobium sp. TaxID=1871066 RepID=UPI0011F7A946|nr:NAD(P)/FAD-dependent oxidoreductase [Mesorhizobium sp.]TIR48675.1 MAG: NAD(P)/FAD-dependent oxidoreductase [Mesorhizobium sp.]